MPNTRVFKLLKELFYEYMCVNWSPVQNKFYLYLFLFTGEKIQELLKLVDENATRWNMNWTEWVVLKMEDGKTTFIWRLSKTSQQ